MSEILNEKKYVLMSIKPIYAKFIKMVRKQLNYGAFYRRLNMAT